jgi:hypothetical protein
MKTLQKNALGRLPLSVQEVDSLYELYRAGGLGSSPSASNVRRLCESHERLRMELEGSAVLHDDSQKALRQAACDITRLCDGLLRIFARCGDWSADDVRANVADLLRMSVKDAQDQIQGTPPAEQPTEADA